MRRYWGYVLVAGFLVNSHIWAKQIGPIENFTPIALSADNSTIVGFAPGSIAQSDAQGVIWTQETGNYYMPTSPVTPSLPQGISGDGSIIVGYNETPKSGINGPPYDYSAWQLTAAGGYQSLIVPGFIGEKATSISNDGSTIALTAQQAAQLPLKLVTTRAFIWTASSGFTAIPETPSGKTPNTALVSADGNAVIGTSGTGQGYIWTPTGGSQDIPEISGTSLDTPQVITADGSMVFGATGLAGSNNVVFEYTKGITTSLGEPFSGATDEEITLTGITADGNLLVGNVIDGGTGSTYAFVWTPAGGFTSLENFLAAKGIGLTDYASASVDGVSSDGDVLFGENELTDGHQGIDNTAWIFYLPEPNSLTLFFPLATGLTRIRKVNRTDV
jgi:hypothetical protein